jgi:hypothetical protein
MKVKSLLYTSLAASLLFASCNLNEQPVFDDATQAFIAFSATSGYVFEAVDGVPDTLKIELYCASVAGITASVQVEVTDTAYAESQRAQEGVHYNILSDTEIHFDAEHRFATVKIVPVDDNELRGNKRFDLVLTSVDGCNMGANKRFEVIILDDEDPMNAFIGTYTATAESAFTGVSTQVWTATIERDFEKETRIYITPICEILNRPGTPINTVTATVDLDGNVLYVPLSQELYNQGDTDQDGEDNKLVLTNLNQSVSGSIAADVQINGMDVSIVFHEGYGIFDPMDPGGFYQALQAPTFVKQ